MIKAVATAACELHAGGGGEGAREEVAGRQKLVSVFKVGRVDQDLQVISQANLLFGEVGLPWGSEG
jgi:hypothetical protein